MTIAHGFRHTNAGELPATKIALICILDDPLLVTNNRASAGGWGLGKLHVASL